MSNRCKGLDFVDQQWCSQYAVHRDAAWPFYDECVASYMEAVLIGSGSCSQSLEQLENTVQS